MIRGACGPCGPRVHPLGYGDHHGCSLSKGEAPQSGCSKSVAEHRSTVKADPIRVLIVDDDVRVAQNHCELVDSMRGFEAVARAHTAGEALAAVRRHRPDLMLLDLFLPDASGMEVLKELRGPRAEAEEGLVDVLVITALPKGLTVATADLVAEAPRVAGADLSASEVSECTGVARVTARRYLEHHCAEGRADLELRYGQAGRPEHRYRWRA